MDESSAPDDGAWPTALRKGWLQSSPASYRLTSFVFLRALGAIYSVAFLILHNQMLPLIGSKGLQPANLFMERVHQHASFWRLPGIFWFDVSDTALTIAKSLGLALSIAVMCGVE